MLETDSIGLNWEHLSLTTRLLMKTDINMYATQTLWPAKKVVSISKVYSFRTLDRSNKDLIGSIL